MKSFLFLVIVVAVQVVIADDAIRDRRAIGSHPIEIQDYPFMVSVLHWGIHTCGGSIISRRYVLTAAYCVRGPAEQYAILSGTKYKNREGALRLVDKIVISEKYSKEEQLYDAALLRVEKPFVFDSKTQPIELFESSETFESSSGLFIGWGDHDGEWYLYDSLMAVDLSIHDKIYCHQRLRRFHGESQVCAGDKHHNIRTTDIGGPLIINGRLYGIAINYARSEFERPATFTEIAVLYNWIEQYSKL